MAATKLTASGTSDGYVVTVGDDGSLEIWVGPNGAKILAATFSAAGKLALPAQSMIRLNTSNGFGSTNTVIRRFLNTVTSQGTDITYADSATLGASFTVNANGMYAITFTESANGTAPTGISFNSSQLTSAINTINVADRLCMAETNGAGSGIANPSWTGYLLTGAVIRPHTSGVVVNVAAHAQFTITRVA